MLMSGLIVFAFIVYHLLHYTLVIKQINLTGQDFAAFMDSENRHDIFKMMVVGFSNPWVSIFYVVGIALLCLHLSHGVSAMFQSLGWKNKVYGPCLDSGARLSIAWLIFIGYVSIPISGFSISLRIALRKGAREVIWLSIQKFHPARSPKNGSSTSST